MEDQTKPTQYFKYKDTYVKYRQSNKEKCNGLTKEWIKKHKNIVNCGCGSSIEAYRLKRHETSKKHQRYLLSNQPVKI